MLRGMTNSRIVIAAKPRTPVTVDLVGHEYVVTPAKSTVGLALAERLKTAGEDPGAVMEEVEGYVGLIFGNKQKRNVMARLRDGNDDLDLNHIMELMGALAEQGSANPSS